jgi:homoserine dehydrogenase
VRLSPPEHITSRYYLRLTVKDEPGVLAQIAQVTAKNHLSIASVIQTAAEPANAACLILTTHQSNERAIRATLKHLARLRSVLEEPLLLRIGDFTD